MGGLERFEETGRVLGESHRFVGPGRDHDVVAPERLARIARLARLVSCIECAGSSQRSSLVAKDLAHHAFESSAYHGVAHAPADREPQSVLGPVAGADKNGDWAS